MNRKLLGVLATLSAPLLAAGCATTAPTEQASGGFPDSLDAITMVVGFSAGGSTDTVARLVAPILEAELGKPVQVLNRPEGNGQIALQDLADAPTNGSVVGSVNLPSVFTSYLDPNTDVDYDRASFTPIGAVTNFGTVLVTSADSPYKTLDDLADAVKSKPDTVNLAAGAVDYTKGLEKAVADPAFVAAVTSSASAPTTSH
jgi:tripartite-type tricarboxylate transporter receptor subunit TctC